MSRTPVTLRPAVLGDAEQLAWLWTDVLRRTDHAGQVGDMMAVIERTDTDPHQRIVVAEYDGEFAGAVILWATTISPINTDRLVQAISPHVVPHLRKRGIGHCLMEAAVDFAEELGIAHLGSAAVSNSREANRFLARLALGPQATLRIAPLHAVRAKLLAQKPRAARTNGRHVVAVRRSLRRQSSTA